MTQRFENRPFEAARISQLLGEAGRHSQRGEPARALALTQEAVQLAPHRLDAWLQLATLRTTLSQHDLAVDAFDSMLARTPENGAMRAHLLALRAQALLVGGRWALASTGADGAAEIEPRNSETDHLIGVLYTRIGRIDAASRHLRAAAEASRTNAGYQYSLGAIYRFEGRNAESEAAFERAIALKPSSGQSHLALAQLSTWRLDRNHCARITDLLTDPDLSAADRECMHFAAHKEFHDIGDYASAWSHLEMANDLAASARPWSESQDDARCEATKREFPMDRLKAAARSVTLAHGQARPIFIVGLPRSGSTLIERILSGHSAVRSLGELPILDQCRKRHGVWNTSAIGDAYRREIQALRPDASFVIDKQPLNYWNVGLIAEALPDAIIIATHRRPIDHLFGTYRMHLGLRYPWCYSLQSAAKHYTKYKRLMAYWAEGLGSRLIVAHHDQLTREPNLSIERLLTACGLESQSMCFTPHNNEAPVTTASAAQVREPINNRGSGVWRAYAARLTPFLQTLRALGVDTAEDAREQAE